MSGSSPPQRQSDGASQRLNGGPVHQKYRNTLQAGQSGTVNRIDFRCIAVQYGGLEEAFEML